MAQVKKEELLKDPNSVLSVSEYCKQRVGVTPQAIYYAMREELVDWCTFGGHEKYIVMTENTKQYVPNGSPKRLKKVTKAK